MESRDGHCARLQEKVTKDAQHIKSLGSIIDKLRVDIGGLQKTIDTVKNTQVGQEPSKPKHHHHHRHHQERVRSEYEETLMKQRALFDEEIVALTEGMREEAKVCIM